MMTSVKPREGVESAATGRGGLSSEDCPSILAALLCPVSRQMDLWGEPAVDNLGADLSDRPYSWVSPVSGPHSLRAVPGRFDRQAAGPGRRGALSHPGGREDLHAE